MKKTFLIIVTLILFNYLNIYAQFEQAIADVSSETIGTYPKTTEVLRGGQEKTATGTLKVLVVFVRYLDDTQNTTYWPDYNVLPTWAQTFVNQSIPQNNIFTPKNLSDFFDRSSGGNGNGNLGQFHVIGDVVYVTTLYNKTHYTNDTQVFTEIFQTLDNPNGQYNINFKQYDNWEFMRNSVKFNHYYLPGVGDGIVDHIWVMNRDTSRSGVAAEKSLESVNYPTNDGVTIKSNSGSRIFQVKNNITPKSVGGPAHEYCHYLFGGGQSTGHFDGRVYNNFGNTGRINSFALMCAINAGYMCGYEKYRLGWLNPTIIEQNTNVFTLGNTHINNQAVIIPLRYDQTTGWLKEYYFIENYETTEEYAGANPFLVTTRYNYILKHGLLVYHIKNEDFNIATNGSISIVNADGRFAWHLVTGANTPYNRSDDLIGKDYPTYHSAYDYRNYITMNVGGVNYTDYACLIHHQTTDPDGWRYNQDDFLGTNRDFFNPDFNNVFTKFSNPAAYLGDDVTATNVGFQVSNFDAQLKEYTLSIQINTDGVTSLAPSKPQNLKASLLDRWTALLTWEPNTEPDVITNGKYKIYRAEDDVNGMPSSWEQIALIDAYNNGQPVISVIDDQIGPSYYTSKVFYKISAVDNTQLESLCSDYDWVSGKVPKIVSDNKIQNIEYSLEPNYPNPFNPSTIINFAVKDAGFVSLKVYDILGSEVATLVNETKEAGNFAVEFNAAKLPSGVYIFTLQVNGFTSSKKMLLMK